MAKIKNPSDRPALEAAMKDAGVSLTNLQNELAQACAGLALFKNKDGNNIGGPWVRDLCCPGHEEGETWCGVISAPDGKTYEQCFVIEGGKVKLSGDPEEVIAQVNYEAVVAPEAVEARKTSVEKASTDANECSGDCETAEDHEEAATAHEHAAKLHAEGGNADQAAVHLAHAKTHRDLAAKVVPAPIHAREKLTEGDALFARAAFQFTPGAAPQTHMWMPEGVHYIECGHGSKAWKGFVQCKKGDEEAPGAALEAHLASGKKPYMDFDHQKLEASAWPKRYFWSDTAPRGIFVEEDWTGKGNDSLVARTYRGFSPGFYVDAVHGKRALTARKETSEADPANLIGAPLVMGGLTNDPAFDEMAPLWASHRTEELSSVPSGPGSAAGALASSQPTILPPLSHMTVKEKKTALQARKNQLAQKITELTAKNDDASKTALGMARSEHGEVMANIETQDALERVEALEARETLRKENAADQAVETLVEKGVVQPLDRERKAELKAKFIKDPDLIPVFMEIKSPLSARTTANANGERFSTGGARLIHGERRVKAITVIKEGAALCARSAKQRNPLGNVLTAELAAAKSQHAREFSDIYFNDISPELGASSSGLLNMRIGDFMAELTAATDSDGIGTLAGTLVLQRTLEFFRLNYPLFTKIYTDFSDQPALLNQTLDTRSIGTLAVQTYNNTTNAGGFPQGWNTVSPATTTDVPIVVDEHVGVPVVFGSNTLMSTLRRVFDEMAPPMAYALAQYFVQKIYKLFTPANYNAYAVVTPANALGIVKVPVAYATYAKGLNDFARSAMVDLNAIMNPNEVPLHDRIVLLNSAYYGKASTDPSLITFWAGQRDPELITEGELPRMSKFTPIEAPDFPAANNGVGMALQKNGVVAIGRPPADYTKVLQGASYGTSTMVTDPEMGLTSMLVQYVNHDGGYAASRMETAIGAKVGDKRGGLLITSQ